MEHVSNIALVTVPGDLDVTSIAPLRRCLDELLAQGCVRIVLNLAKVRYIDSSGMGLIIAYTRRMRERGALLSLVNASPHVLRALSIARVVDMLPVSGVAAVQDVADLSPQALPSWRTTVAIDPSHLGETRAHVNRLVERMPFSDDERFDLVLAIGEAMGNAVDHAAGTALVSVSCYEDRALVDVTDCGSGFELKQGERAPLSDCVERGRGIELMRLLADEVSISRRDSGAGTVVRIVKLFRSQGPLAASRKASQLSGLEGP